MVLVDTNVWINHFRKTDAELVANLNTGSVVCHPFIIGELACGNLQNRKEILELFQSLPPSPTVESDELLTFIESNSLMGKGLGYVDMHLLASAVLAGIELWTNDRRLRLVSQDIGISYSWPYRKQ
jgi:predicted nucleic acid-binding protein